MSKPFVFGSIVLLLASACSTSDDPHVDNPDGPGSAAWDSDDVVCQETAECGQGEVCENGVCQMARCSDEYQSSAPMAATHYFGVDAEYAIVGDGQFIDGFESSDGGYLGSWELTGTVVDVTGGNLTGERPQSIVAAFQYDENVRINDAQGDRSFNIGIWPRAIAAGDVDADGIDELVALGEDGTLSVCNVDEGTCLIGVIDEAEGGDVAVADVDGDGYDEPLFLLRYGGETTLVIWNLDFEKTQQDETVAWEFNFPLKSIGAGDLDGDRVAEVVGLEDGGWWGWADDKMHVFSPSAGELTVSQGVSGHSSDVTVGDRDSDDVDEVGLLRDDQKFELFTFGQGALTSQYVKPVGVGAASTRLAMMDWDGDSTSGRLVEGPTLVAGDTVPVTVYILPPYEHGISEGRSGLWVGRTGETGESTSDTVSLSLGMTVAYGVELGSIFEAKVGVTLGQEYSKTHTESTLKTVGERFDIQAYPEQFGNDYAGVVLGCGCFHKYQYLVDDPAGKTGGDGGLIDVYMPVGGNMALFSTKRYNAMAEVLGNLPIVTVPSRVGDVDSYPAEPVTLGGAPVLAEDMLVGDSPTLAVSDLGEVGFWISIAESTENEVAQTVSLGVEGSLGFLGAEVSVDASISQGTSYGIHVGEEAVFAGQVPALWDDLDTPEDEFETYRYTYKPYIYREHYVDKAGEDAAYYVMNYTVGR